MLRSAPPTPTDGVARAKGVILLCLLLAATFAGSVTPFMGVFIVEDLGQDPWRFSLYSIAVICVALVVNRTFGERIDGGAKPRSLILLAAFAALVGVSAVALLPSYWMVLFVLAPCMGLGNTAISSSYSLGRLYVAAKQGADRERLRVYNSRLRMMTSLGWMVGPPAIFLAAEHLGVDLVFRVAMGLALLWMVAAWGLLPRDFRGAAKDAAGSGTGAETANPALWMAALVCLLFSLAHVLTTFALPVYYTAEVGLPLYAPGLSFAIKCAVEVGAIALAPWVMGRLGKRGALYLAAGLGMLSFGIYYQVDSLAVMVLGALVEGFYYGLFAAVGMSFVQEQSRGRLGRATSLYMNSLSLGAMLGHVSMGLIATAVDFRTVLPVGIACLVVAIGALVATRSMDRAGDDFTEAEVEA